MDLFDEALMTEREFAAFVRQKLSTVQRWRTEGLCPPYFQSGRKVILYKRSDIAAWLSRRYVAEPRKIREQPERADCAA